MYVLVNWAYTYYLDRMEMIEQDRREKAEAKAAEDRKRLYRDMSLKELRQYDGHDGRPIFIAARNVIFDMTTRPDCYGPEAGYGILAGRDGSRALGTMSLKPEDVEQPSISDFNFEQSDTLDQWIALFLNRYEIVGKLIGAKCGKIPERVIRKAMEEKAAGVDRSILSRLKNKD